MATYNITIINNGSSDYIFNGSHAGGILSGSNDPSLTFDAGDVVNFTFSQSSMHPFLIRQGSSTVFGPYTSGTQSWNVSSGSYTYVCQNHSSMQGSISVAGGATTTTTATTTTQAANTTTTTTTTTQAANTTTTTQAANTTTTTQAPTNTTTQAPTNTTTQAPTNTTTQAPANTTTTQSPTTQVPNPQVPVTTQAPDLATPVASVDSDIITNDGDTWTLPNTFLVFGAAREEIMDLRRTFQFNFHQDSIVYDVKIKEGYSAYGYRNVFFIRNITTPTLNLYRGKSYILDLRDPSNLENPIRLYTRAKQKNRKLNIGLFPYDDGVSYFGKAGEEYGLIYFTVPEDAPDMLFYDSLNGLQYGGRINIKSTPVATTEPPPAVPPLRLPPDNLYVYDTSSVVCDIQGACVPRTGKGRKSDIRYRIPDYEFLNPLTTTVAPSTTQSVSTTSSVTTTFAPDENPYDVVKYPDNAVVIPIIVGGGENWYSTGNKYYTDKLLEAVSSSFRPNKNTALSFETPSSTPPPNHDDTTVWDGNYTYFIQIYRSGSHMPEGIHASFTRTINNGFYGWENRNNAFDHWIPDALNYQDVELQWQIAGEDVSRRQGWENREDPNTEVFSYVDSSRAQFSNTILPEDYEPESVGVVGTQWGMLAIERQARQELQIFDHILFISPANYITLEDGGTPYNYHLTVRVDGNYLVTDVVCPPENPDIFVRTFDSRPAGYTLRSSYSTNDDGLTTASSSSINRNLGGGSTDVPLLGGGMDIYIPSVCQGAEESTQVLNAVLRASPNEEIDDSTGVTRRTVGDLKSYHSIEYSKTVNAELAGENTISLSWQVPKETQIIYDYTDSEWYMAHSSKPEVTKERYEIYGDDTYDLYGYEFQWISNKPDETGWHHWFKLTSDDILPTEGSRDMFYTAFESNIDLGYTKTVIRGRDGVRYGSGDRLTLNMYINSGQYGFGVYLPGVDFVEGIAKEHQLNNGVTAYESYNYLFRVRAIYRCNRTTGFRSSQNQNQGLIMPDGTYQQVQEVEILIASSDYSPFKIDDPLPTPEEFDLGTSFHMENIGQVAPTTFFGRENFKTYALDSVTPTDGVLFDSILDPNNTRPTTE